MLAAGLDGGYDHRTAFEALARRLGEWPLLLEIANGMLRKEVARGRAVGQALERHGVEGIARDNADARRRGGHAGRQPGAAQGG